MRIRVAKKGLTALLTFKSVSVGIKRLNLKINLAKSLLVQPRIRPSGNFWKTEVWQLKLQGFVSGQPPIRPLK